MRKSLFFLLLASSSLLAQVTTIPKVVQKSYMGEVTIIFNPNEGNKGMVGASACYAHTGITYNGTAWQKAGTWRDGLDKYKMTKNADGCWELKITPNMFEYYGVPETTQIDQLCFVFNDGPGGSKEGKAVGNKDIFVDLEEQALAIKILSPERTLFFATDSIPIHVTVSDTSSLFLIVNSDTISQFKGISIDTTIIANDTGSVIITVYAKNEEAESHKAQTLVVVPKTTSKPLPENMQLGINYNTNDRSKLTLATFAAACAEPNDPSQLIPALGVFVIGDFNNWKLSPQYQMYRDSCTFWLPLDNLDSTREYAYQYVVIRPDGVQKQISDGFAYKQLHPDDKYEPSKTIPNLKSYPQQGDGYVSVLQTTKEQYQWSDATLNFKRPNKNNLVIYELWTYDYTPERNFAGLMKRLDYLQDLGVNAIELMPVSEFEGNYNWGYSPTHYFAVDKAYGSNTQFKQLVDSIHARGMAVIVDMVFNHATGLNPQNKLYPYGDDLKFNPWFNVSAPHNDNVYEDWNHDFPQTKQMFTRCLQYWLTEFKIDGFRMDLSHGFCGKTNNAMNNIRHYYQNAILATDPNAYFILEHWGNNMYAERLQLIKEGMLCWHQINNQYNRLAGGLISGSDISSANQKGFVSYCESHDEERNFYAAKTNGDPTIRSNDTTRLNRVPLTIAFNLFLAGCHMLWQYEELGYDYSINSTQGSNTINTSNRTAIKTQPAELNWFNSSLRMQQFEKVAQIIKLRTQIAPELFDTIPTQTSIASGNVRSILWRKNNKQIYITGNFNATEAEDIFTPAGNWFNYFTTLPQKDRKYKLKPGELLILTSEQYTLPKTKTSLHDISTIEHLIYNNTQKRLSPDGYITIIRDEAVYNIDGKRKH